MVFKKNVLQSSQVVTLARTLRANECVFNPTKYVKRLKGCDC